MTWHPFRAVVRIVAGAVAALLIGYWQGNPLLFLAIYGLIVSMWQVWQQLRFERWLDEFGGIGLTGRWSQLARRITDRLARERDEGRQSETELSIFRDLARNFPDGIVMLEADLQISWYNAAAGTSLGLAASDVGQPVGHLIRAPEFIDTVDAAGDELIIESPTDSAVSLLLQFVRVAERRILVVRDVSAFQKSEAARHDFVANASHELRSPLTVISGYLDTLATDETLEPVWQVPVREMLRQSRRMSDLLTDLMDLSRLDRMHLKAEWHPIDMEALITHVKSDFAELTGNAEIVVSVDSSYLLLGEQAEIVSAVTNLVANAVRYSGDEPKVSITWTVDDEGGHLAISDNGIGIPQEDIPRITERFYRVDKGRSREKGGTGLGLAIVRNTLSRHEARLEIQSKLNEGSVFICHFPASRIELAAGHDVATG